VGHHSTGWQVSGISSRPGASGFRSICTIISILILISIFFYSINDLNQRATSIAHYKLIDELNIALSFSFYQAAIHGKLSELPNLHQANPFKVLPGRSYQLPQDYVREVASESELNMAGWYFDVGSKAIYFWDEVKLTESYQLQFIYDDLNQTGQFEASADKVEKLEMVALK
jgi:hypothetical protein